MLEGMFEALYCGALYKVADNVYPHTILISSSSSVRSGVHCPHWFVRDTCVLPVMVCLESSPVVCHLCTIVSGASKQGVEHAPLFIDHLPHIDLRVKWRQCYSCCPCLQVQTEVPL